MTEWRFIAAALLVAPRGAAMQGEGADAVEAASKARKRWTAVLAAKQHADCPVRHNVTILD
jgi:hypothetical protein